MNNTLLFHFILDAARTGFFPGGLSAYALNVLVLNSIFHVIGY